MATSSNRGKFAESEVKKWMTKRSDADAGFWFYRYPDPHAGSLQSVPADFGVLLKGAPHLVEVKEVKITAATSRRLPQANFSADKVARIRKFCMAGGEGWVVVCHMPAQEWRVVPIYVFFERQASWDISAHKVYASVALALKSIFGEKQ